MCMWGGGVLRAGGYEEGGRPMGGGGRVLSL